MPPTTAPRPMPTAPVFVMAAQGDDRLVETGIAHPRHGQQELPGEIFRILHSDRPSRPLPYPPRGNATGRLEIPVTVIEGSEEPQGTRRMTIAIGDRLPEATLVKVTADGPDRVSTTDYFAGRKIALFAVPGAFTPTCSAKHLPGFAAKVQAFRDKLVDEIACTSVNDAFVLGAWAKANDVQGVTMLADGNWRFRQGDRPVDGRLGLRHGPAQPALFDADRGWRGDAAECRGTRRVQGQQRRASARPDLSGDDAPASRRMPVRIGGRSALPLPPVIGQRPLAKGEAVDMAGDHLAHPQAIAVLRHGQHQVEPAGGNGWPTGSARGRRRRSFQPLESAGPTPSISAAMSCSRSSDKVALLEPVAHRLAQIAHCPADRQAVPRHPVALMVERREPGHHRLDLRRLLGDMGDPLRRRGEALARALARLLLDQAHLAEHGEGRIDEAGARRIGAAGQLLDRLDEFIAVARASAIIFSSTRRSSPPSNIRRPRPDLPDPAPIAVGGWREDRPMKNRLIALSALLAMPAHAAEPPRPLYLGADLSFANEMEDCGAVYRQGGKPVDPFMLMRTCRRQSGARAAVERRSAGRRYSNLADVEKTIRRAHQAGLQVLLDFHYADDWADGDKQPVPAAWAAMDTPAQVRAVHDFTRATLDTLAAKGLTPELVQVGNETNGELMAGPTKAIDWTRNAALLGAGLRAVREAAAAHGKTDPHHAPYRPAGPCRALEPMTGLASTIERLRATHGKEVVVVETAYPYTLDNADASGNLLGADSLVTGYPATPAGQRAYMIDLTRTVVRAGGSGVVYWAPDWISTRCSTRWGQGSGWENAAWFDLHRRWEALPVLDFLRQDYRRR
ncbi:hypothetical protein SASPL_156560 [Salvia splendens]|uniref:glutaredoxin-dependent peroxiredoxin n=1 Tax=Salvia splendens TaxID=180675 RepID=A0A8X8VWM3_SALSN|nr:hypothetical protein SASPL_156560 [Salvia splendens]